MFLSFAFFFLSPFSKYLLVAPYVAGNFPRHWEEVSVQNMWSLSVLKLEADMKINKDVPGRKSTASAEKPPAEMTRFLQWPGKASGGR